MSSFGLSRQLGIERQVAEAYIATYFERYPKIRAYMEQTRLFAHQYGYVETLHKRKLYLPEINATNLQRQKASERAAINAPLQGTAAEIIKMAMISIDKWLQEAGISRITSFMVETIKLDVPLQSTLVLIEIWLRAH